MVDEQKFPVDNTKKSPGTNINLFEANSYWQKVLDNNDFLALYRRHGIARKIVDKFSSEMFKKGFVVDDNVMKVIFDFKLDSVSKFAWVNSAVSGYCLVYVDYGDINNFSDYLLPAPGGDPVGFVVVPRAWVSEDIKQKDQNNDREAYQLYQENGSTFWVHRSRMIRISNNENESSIYEPVFNAFSVADNILWSVGQTLWRVGQGFPVLTIDNPKMINDGKGNMKSELDILTESGALRDISSEVGYIADARYNLEFKGAGGVALKPMEYWDICLQWIGMSVNVPKDILVGISAGAVTGSETNLREYYSMLHSKQVQEVQPIYEALLGTFGLVVNDFSWNIIFEQNQKELAETFKINSEAIGSLVFNNVICSEQAFELLKISNPDFEKVENIICSERVNNLDKNFVKGQYAGLNDKEFDVSLKKSLVEGSALPKGVQRVEKRFLKEMGSQYKSTGKVVENIFEAFNTDEQGDV